LCFVQQACAFLSKAFFTINHAFQHMRFFSPKLFMALAILIATAYATYHVKTVPAPDQAQAFDYTLEAKEEARKAQMRPEELEHITHGGLMGFPWQSAQARTWADFRDIHHAVRDRNMSYGPFKARWMEKGPAQIPGRVTGSAVLFQQKRIYLLNDGGYIFRSNTLTGNDWECLNDHYPLTRGVSGRLEVLSLPNGSNRILVGGWDAQNLSAKFLKYSDDEGQTWKIPEGLPDGNWYRRTIAAETGKVWHMIRSDASGSPKMQLYYSTDYGARFSLLYSHNLTQGDYDRRCDFWKPADTDTLFSVFEDVLIKISPTADAQTIGKISNKPHPEWVVLTGGRASAAHPYTLYYRIWDGSENGVYRSVDGGGKWSKWSVLTDGLHTPFSLFSFVTNPEDPAKLYSGGWIVGETTDGVVWTNPHDLGGYVGYHGDVPDMNFVKNPQTDRYELFIGTDGGFYQYQPADNTFASLSIRNLNNTQIYKMVSDQSATHRMYIGTQDNGFNYNLVTTATDAVAPFNYLWGGDVTQVTSGDGGKSFWCFWIGSGCNYVQDAAQIKSSGIANWGPVNDSGYWETPAKADPQAPGECLVAGHKPPSTSGSYLIRLKAPAGLAAGELKPLEVSFGSYDFSAASGGGRIGAISISPLNNNHIYVMTENGVFFWSLDKGITWQKNETAKNKIWVRYITASPVTPGEVFIGGAAYGNNTPCWKTNNHGQSLVSAEPASSSVLRDNRVNALCFDPEGKYVFAAADIGAFVYVIAENKWQIISGAPAPVSHYHDVEYLSKEQTVRFATYARGVWDFKIEGTLSALKDNMTSGSVDVFPNPATQYITVPTESAQWMTILDASGRIMYRSACQDGATTIGVRQWASGIYWVVLENKGERRTGKWLKV
jgi:hypothetical protein